MPLFGGGSLPHQALHVSGGADALASELAAIAFGGHHFKKLADVTLGAAATAIGISGLDLDASKAFLIIAHVKAVAGQGPTVYIELNEDETGSNYHIERLSADGSAVSGSRANNAEIGWAMTTAGVNTYFILIQRGVDGLAHFQIIGERGSGTSSLLVINVGNWVTNANVTSVEIRSSVASGFDTGSSFLLFGVSG